MRLFKWLCPFLYVLLLLQSVNAAGCADIKGKTERLSCIKTQNAARQNAFRSNYSGVKLSKSVQTTKTLPGQQKQAAAVLATKKKLPMQPKLSALDIHKQKVRNTIAKTNPIKTNRSTKASKKYKKAKRKKRALDRFARGQAVSAKVQAPVTGRTFAMPNNVKLATKQPAAAASQSKTAQATVAKKAGSVVKSAGTVSAQVSDRVDSDNVIDLFDTIN